MVATYERVAIHKMTSEMDTPLRAFYEAMRGAGRVKGEMGLVCTSLEQSYNNPDPVVYNVEVDPIEHLCSTGL